MFQHTGQELADNLKVCMTGALQNYHTVNGYMPERIIVYRDGVGDGQVSTLPTVKFSNRRNHFFLLLKKICSLPFPCLLFTGNGECEVVGKAAQYEVVYRKNSRATTDV